MPTIQIYRSDDASAPALSGTVGSMIALLDACLVDGYGAKAAAGWTKPYTGTNLAAYRMGTGGTARRMYLRVDDTNAQIARWRGFDDMTDVNTGTEPFPTVAQQADPGMAHYKSSAASGTARPWVMIATEVFFYLFVQSNQTILGADQGASIEATFFGEYIPVTFTSPFEHHVALIGSQSTSGSGTGGALASITAPTGHVAIHGNSLCRSHLNVAGAVWCSKFIEMSVTTSTAISGFGNGNQNVTVPNPADGKLYGSRVWLVSPFSIVGRLPGIWAPFASGTSLGGSWLDTIDGSGPLTGRTLTMFHVPATATISAANASCRAFFDLDNMD
jgi:hypothetical protein